MSIFNSELILGIMEYLVDEGISLVIEQDINGNVVVDVQTMAKSDLKLWCNDKFEVVALMRYNEVRVIESIDDVLHAVKGCLHGRDFISMGWAELLQREGILGETW